MSGRRQGIVATCLAAVLSAGLALPAAAAANPVQNLLDQVRSTVNGLSGGGGSDGSTVGGTTTAPSGGATTQGGTPPDYVPPLHGTNPHGQGTVAIGDLQPVATEPLPYDPGGGSEDLVVGQSRGEQNANGSYHGHITILALLGNEIVGVDTGPGEHDSGPLGPINEQLCPLNGGGTASLSLCVLGVDSNTTNSGSSNSFETVGANLNLGGNEVLRADVASSNGSISDDGECQTAHGDSNAASASVGGELTADALQSSSDSQACNGSAPTQSNSSTVINLAGQGVPIPATGCADGTPNTAFTSLASLLATVCNADDTNGAQAALPYGVREALDVFAIEIGGPLLKATTAAAESHAVAPGPPQGPRVPPGVPRAPRPLPPLGPGQQLGPSGPGAAPGPSAAGPGGPQLPFTGADVLILALIGFGVMGTGLSAMALADRRRRQEV